jgi:hypothetical protein
MTSERQYVLSHLDIQCLNMLAVRHPEKDRTLLALYVKYHKHQPRDKKWHIEGGPPTAHIKDSGVRLQVTLKFYVIRTLETEVFELAGSIQKAIPLGDKGHEWLLVVTGTLWRWGVNNTDNIKAENVTIPCFYNSHTRKGFGLVPMITSYEVYGAGTGELQEE